MELNYRRAPFFAEYFPALSELLRSASAGLRLAELTIGLLRWLAEELGIKTPIVRSSELAAQGKRTDLLAEICNLSGATTYVSPLGSADYLLSELPILTGRGVDVVFQHYEHPTYRQLFPPFQAHASTLDLLFNEGENALAIIRSGRSRAVRSLQRLRSSRTQPRVPSQAGLLLDCNQPVGICAAAVSKGCLGFLEAYLGKLVEVCGNVIRSQEMLGAVKLVGLGNGELKCIVPESYPFAKAVVVGGPQDYKSFPSGSKDSVHFRNGSSHFVCSAVIKHSVAQDDSKTAIRVGKSKHRSLRQACLANPLQAAVRERVSDQRKTYRCQTPETQAPQQVSYVGQLPIRRRGTAPDGVFPAVRDWLSENGRHDRSDTRGGNVVFREVGPSVRRNRTCQENSRLNS